jgi:hypothetical protein
VDQGGAKTPFGGFKLCCLEMGEPSQKVFLGLLKDGVVLLHGVLGRNVILVGEQRSRVSQRAKTDTDRKFNRIRPSMARVGGIHAPLISVVFGLSDTQAYPADAPVQ